MLGRFLLSKTSEWELTVLKRTHEHRWLLYGVFSFVKWNLRWRPLILTDYGTCLYRSHLQLRVVHLQHRPYFLFQTAVIMNTFDYDSAVVKLVHIDHPSSSRLVTWTCSRMRRELCFFIISVLYRSLFSKITLRPMTSPRWKDNPISARSGRSRHE